VELLKATTDDQEVLVSHRNAALTPVHRLKLARLIVDQGWPVARAAEWFHVSWPTAKLWSERYREVGAAGMEDHSSRPHHSPMRTRQPVVRQIVHLPLKQRLGPVDIAHRLGNINWGTPDGPDRSGAAFPVADLVPARCDGGFGSRHDNGPEERKGGATRWLNQTQ